MRKCEIGIEKIQNGILIYADENGEARTATICHAKSGRASVTVFYNGRRHHHNLARVMLFCFLDIALDDIAVRDIDVHHIDRCNWNDVIENLKLEWKPWHILIHKYEI